MKNVIDIRNYGLAGAIQIAPRDGDAIVRPFDAAMKLWKAGFYVRFGGDTLQFGPTFNSKAQDLDRLFDAVNLAAGGELRSAVRFGIPRAPCAWGPRPVRWMASGPLPRPS